MEDPASGSPLTVGRRLEQVGSGDWGPPPGVPTVYTSYMPLRTVKTR